MSLLLQQETQVSASCAPDRDDNVTPSELAFETNAISLLDDINNLSSAISNLYDGQATDWFTDLVVPSLLEPGTARGVNDLNTALHNLEKKRVMRDVHSLTDITIPAGQNFIMLGAGEIPAQTLAAVDLSTELGTVVAAHTAFGAHSLDEVVGNSALNPKNLMAIVDGASRDPILSGGRKIYGLLQAESAADGHVIAGATPTRVQISFVRQNAAGDDLEAVPVADIENASINYCTRERIRIEDLSEQDFLTGAIVDVGAGAGTIDLSTAYANQGSTPVPVATNSDLDLATGIEACYRDALAADLFCVKEGSATSDSTVALGADVDVFDNNALVNDFAAGATIGSGGASPIVVGVTDGVIGTSAGDMTVAAAGELVFDDLNKGTSTYAAPFKLSEDPAEFDDFETKFGEVSLLNAICQAAGANSSRRVWSVVTTNLASGVNVSGPATDNNLDAELGDLSAGTFVDDYIVRVNGQDLRLDAAAGGPGSVYPGANLALGQLIFNVKLKAGSTIEIVDNAA